MLDGGAVAEAVLPVLTAAVGVVLVTAVLGLAVRRAQVVPDIVENPALFMEAVVVVLAAVVHLEEEMGLLV